MSVCVRGGVSRWRFSCSASCASAIDRFLLHVCGALVIALARAMGVECLPVELDAVAGSVGRESETVLDPQRLSDEAVETEAVGFEVGTVRHGREQMHGEVVGAM